MAFQRNFQNQFVNPAFRPGERLSIPQPAGGANFDLQDPNTVPWLKKTFEAGVGPTGVSFGILDPMTQQDMFKQGVIGSYYKRQLEQDLEKGRKRGAEVYGEGSLGRLDSKLTGRMREQASQGFTAPQYQALRERSVRDFNNRYSTGLRDLRQSTASSGAQGGVNFARRLALEKQRSDSAANAMQDLMVKDIDFRNQSTRDFFQTQQYDQGQDAKEKAGRQAYEFGQASIGAGQRGAANRYVAGNNAIVQANQSQGGGKG